MKRRKKGRRIGTKNKRTKKWKINKCIGDRKKKGKINEGTRETDEQLDSVTLLLILIRIQDRCTEAETKVGIGLWGH
jgi:hypothetical protein